MALTVYMYYICYITSFLLYGKDHDWPKSLIYEATVNALLFFKYEMFCSNKTSSLKTRGKITSVLFKFELKSLI